MTGNGKALYETVLGIDPGTAMTGYAVVSLKQGIRVGGIIKQASKVPVFERIQHIHTTLREIIKDYQVDLVVCEDFVVHRRPSTQFKNMNLLLGAIIALGAHHELEVQLVDPWAWQAGLMGYSRRKKAISKTDIKRVVERRLNGSLEALGNKISKDGKTGGHISDAAGIALYCLEGLS